MLFEDQFFKRSHLIRPLSPPLAPWRTKSDGSEWERRGFNGFWMVSRCIWARGTNGAFLSSGSIKKQALYSLGTASSGYNPGLSLKRNGIQVPSVPYLPGGAGRYQKDSLWSTSDSWHKSSVSVYIK